MVIHIYGKYKKKKKGMRRLMRLPPLSDVTSTFRVMMQQPSHYSLPPFFFTPSLVYNFSIMLPHLSLRDVFFVVNTIYFRFPFSFSPLRTVYIYSYIETTWTTVSCSITHTFNFFPNYFHYLD